MDADPEAEGGDKNHDTLGRAFLDEDVSILFVEGLALSLGSVNFKLLLNNLFLTNCKYFK